MTNKEILEKAINLAIDGGWGEPELDAKVIATDCFKLGGWHLSQVIYDKSFAKALWGENPIRLNLDGIEHLVAYELPIWKYKLQQMVIAEYPIKYLGDNLPE